MKEKTILAIYGSPRKAGITSQLCGALVDGAERSGNRVIKIFLSELKLNNCTGCRKCQESGRCIIRNDDIEILEKGILEADIIVVACPTHWGNLTGYILTVFERLFGFLIKEQKFGFPIAVNAKGKKAIIITSCSTSWPFNYIFNQSRSVVSRLKEIFRYSKVKIIKKIILSGTFNMKTVPEKYLIKTRKYGEKL